VEQAFHSPESPTEPELEYEHAVVRLAARSILSRQCYLTCSALRFEAVEHVVTQSVLARDASPAIDFDLLLARRKKDVAAILGRMRNCFDAEMEDQLMGPSLVGFLEVVADETAGEEMDSWHVAYPWAVRRQTG